MKLKFDPDAYTIRTVDGVTFRAWEGLCYCDKPVDDIQRLNIYAPVNAAADAVIFMPNTVGGYKPGPAAVPETHVATLAALRHGYVVACVGIRGHLSGEENGCWTGRAPAFVVDMKAAIRYLRHNREHIPGSTQRIVTNGTSAGGALSALTGASGNSSEYEPYLRAIGAAEERDDVFASSCYCPIHNLENADAAYEWQFCGVNDYTRWDGAGTLSDKQIGISQALKRAFPAYLNGLNLRGASGEPLTLNDDGEGSFKAWVMAAVMASAQAELDHPTAYAHAVAGSDVREQHYLQIRDGKVTGLDWNGFLHAITRMKVAPAFDGLNLNTPENAVFGTSDGAKRHFTAVGMRYDEAGGTMAEMQQVRLTNPLSFIGRADMAPHFRIRHGAYDRDTSLAIPVILATLLRNHGVDVDFHLPWGLPHSGDYDLDDLFRWIDQL